MNALDFSPALTELLSSNQLVGKSGKSFDNLGSRSTFNNLVVLRNLFLALKPARTLEIGLAFGASSLIFTESHRELNRPPQKQHVAIDPFQSDYWDACGLMVNERAGLGGYLELVERYSCFELPALAQKNLKFGLVYVDGSHQFEDVFVDFYFINRLVEDGGIVAFDDSSDRQVAKVLRFIDANLNSGWERVDLAPFRADGGKSLKWRVGGLLGKQQLVAYKKIGNGLRNADDAFKQF